MSADDERPDALRAAYVDAAANMLGLEWDTEDLGWISVHSNGRWFLLMLDREDSGFVRIATSASWPPGTPLQSATAAAQRTNRVCKGVKTSLAADTDTVVVAAEIIVGERGAVPDPHHLAVVLDRSLSDLAATLKEFEDEVLLSDLAASLGYPASAAPPEVLDEGDTRSPNP